MRIPPILILGLLAAAACRDDAESPAAPDTRSASASTTSTLAFTQVSAGEWHSCGLTADDRLYCWGKNSQGELGDGSTTNRHVPVLVAGGLHFRQVSAGSGITCATTTGNRAYCWGSNFYGELGSGATTTLPRVTPAAVAGAHQFRRVETFANHTCAVTLDDRAFCWGLNTSGELGIGTDTGPETGSSGAHSTRPVAVLGGHAFRHVTVGWAHSCGVTTDNRVFCWGSNRYGQVGDSTNGWLKVKPVRVAGTQQYRQVDLGLYHSCAVTTGNRGFCWGRGSEGQLGNGSQSSSRWPRPVSGGLSLSQVSAGSWHTCATTTGSRAYCWPDYSGGTGTFAPVPVSGGLLLSQVSAGASHDCGKTPAGRGYCWGNNYPYGELGNGTTEDSPTPVPVADPR